VASGVVRGVDADGRLMLDTPTGPVAVSSGDVTLRA
jgi:biotin-(acetyl-CoA carboxylase) ligase